MNNRNQYRMRECDVRCFCWRITVIKRRKNFNPDDMRRFSKIHFRNDRCPIENYRGKRPSEIINFFYDSMPIDQINDQ